MASVDEEYRPWRALPASAVVPKNCSPLSSIRRKIQTKRPLLRGPTAKPPSLLHADAHRFAGFLQPQGQGEHCQYLGLRFWQRLACVPVVRWLRPTMSAALLPSHRAISRASATLSFDFIVKPLSTNHRSRHQHRSYRVPSSIICKSVIFWTCKVGVIIAALRSAVNDHN